jgi:surface polysaccharide O-acyltransferase-like enzyme
LGVLLIGSEFFSGGHPIGPNMAGAALLFFTGTQPNRKWMGALWPWAQLAFLIYLVHVLFVEALQSVAIRFGTVRSLPVDLSVWGLSLIISAFAARALLRFESLKWAFPR